MNPDDIAKSVPFPRAQAAELGTYYAEPAVRSRIVEFLGGQSLDDITSRYFTADDALAANRRPRRMEELNTCLDQALEVCRSLWDRDSLIAHLDVEYVNFDHPAGAYENPERIFGLQAPVEEVIGRLLREYGIAPLHVLSGRGHHFVWRIRLDSAVVAALAAIGCGPPSMRILYEQPHPPNGERVSAELGAAFAGLGLIMEFIAHRVKESAAPASAIPVELTAVEVGPKAQGREMISIDISEYGDPLHVRVFRAPFSVYYKPWQQRTAMGDNLRNLPPLLFVPRQGIDLEEAIHVMRNPKRAAELAGFASTAIPEQDAGTGRLLAHYAESRLASFHRWFYSQEQHPREKWPETYDGLPMDTLPGCARTFLESPNELLLHPSAMRLLTRVMLALGWHPRHIAGLIHSRFARDYGWGGQWVECDPAMRADFYTRLFAGLFVAGRDDLTNFNCQSAKEEGICPAAECRCNLALYRQSALTRRQHDQLAHRPFNRLLLPTEHS